MKLDIGRKIKALRLASDLTQEELANRASLSKGFISQLENDQTSIQIDSLSDMLDALGISLSDFFSESSVEQVVFEPSDRVAVDDTGAGSFQLLIPGSTHNQMDPVLVTMQPGESLAKSDPHPGEQFGFVLKGTITVQLGKKVHKIKGKSCFYFESDREHQIRNDNGTPASLLWITTPPQM